MKEGCGKVGRDAGPNPHSAWAGHYQQHSHMEDTQNHGEVCLGNPETGPFPLSQIWRREETEMGIVFRLPQFLLLMLMLL